MGTRGRFRIKRPPFTWGALRAERSKFRSTETKMSGAACAHEFIAKPEEWHDNLCAVVSLGSLRRPEHPTAKLVQESEDPRNIIAGKQCKCRQTEPQIRCRLADIADE